MVTEWRLNGYGGMRIQSQFSDHSVERIAGTVILQSMAIFEKQSYYLTYVSKEKYADHPAKGIYL